MVRFLRQGIIVTLLACFGAMMYLNAVLLVANHTPDDSSYQERLRKTEINRLISTNFNIKNPEQVNLAELEKKHKELEQELLSQEEIERQKALSAMKKAGYGTNPQIRTKIQSEHFSIDYLNQIPGLFSTITNKETLEIWKKETCNGKYTIYRDYNKNPVYYSSTDNRNIKCDLRCVGSPEAPPNTEPDIARNGGGNCIHRKHVTGTMENTFNGMHHLYGTDVLVQHGIGDLRSIKGTTSLKSDVPLQYFNWDEFNFMKPPLNKTADGLVAAFISNCGPQYRLDYLKSLMDNGVNVHSYGRCLKNKEEVYTETEKRHASKLDLGGTYKFIFSFENSETEDYITEKVFEAIEAGVVPIYHGGPNPQRWAPANKSIIFADEFESPAQLAKLLLELEKNDTLYNEYLKWKEDGPSKDFIAMIDLGIVHSDCRFCIRSADIDRMVVGEVVTGPYQKDNEAEMTKYKDADALLLKIRKRGKFWLKYIHLEQLTVAELKRKIYEKYPDLGNIYKIYELWDRAKTAITTDQQVDKLLYGHELEVIFEEPASKERGRYTQWYYNKHGLPLET